MTFKKEYKKINIHKEPVQDLYKRGIDASKAIPGNIWINILPEPSGPYRGLMTYEQEVFFAIKGFNVKRGEPKPIDPKVILAIAGMLPDRILKRNLFRSFSPLGEHSRHNFEVEKEIIIPLTISHTIHPQG